MPREFRYNLNMQLYNIKNSTKIVVRLRLAFVLVVLLLCASGIFARHQLYKLEHLQRDAIDYSVSSLDHMQSFDQHLAKITDNAVNQSNADTAEAVTNARASMLEQTSQLKKYIEANDSADIINNNYYSKLIETIPELEGSANRSSDAKLSMLELESKFDLQMSSMESSRKRFNEFTEPLSVDLAWKIEGFLENISSDGTDLTDVSASNFKTMLQDQYRILKISHRMSSLFESVKFITPENSGQNVSNASRLQFVFNTIAQHLINYSDEENRRVLVDIVNDFRIQVIGSRGALVNISAYREFEVKYNDARAEQYDLIQGMANTIDQITKETKTNIEETTSSFNAILRRTIFILSAFGVGILLFLISVNYFVVERQVNKRMLRLTRAVTDIANGDTDLAVGVDGNDEIGTIAKALEVFKENAKELYRSNIELEQFAYSASHDLKSPLRAIENLAQWTLEDAGDELPEECKSNLAQLLNRAKRLTQLQDDLLEYSKADKADNHVDALDVSQVIVELVEVLDPDRNFKITAVNSPNGVYTQITPLRQILLNLINNAIKHHDRKAGEILVDVHVVDDRLIVSVSDDGPGIEKEYHQRIFGLFEKLKSRDEVEGSGLGLSLVQKMIIRNGGSVSVMSDPEYERGCTFTFDWPIANSTVKAA